jgi:hypothetical protein
MRRTTFIRTDATRVTHVTRATSVTAAAVSVLFLLTGCGSSDDGGRADGKAVPPSSASPSPPPSSVSPSVSPSVSVSASVTPSTSRTPPATPASPSPSVGCTDTIVLTAADDGHTVCVVKGGQIRVSLDGSKDRPWASVRAKGTAVLEAVNSGFVLLPGDANAAYRATGTGTARLSSSRPLCAGGSDRVACKAIVEWSVTVTVRGS